MRCLSRLVCLGVLCTLLVASGCQKVNEQRTMKLEPGDTKAVQIGGPDREQQVTVTVNVSGSPVDVYVALDKEAVNQSGEAQVPKNALSKEMKVQGDKTLSAKIPAKSAYAVVVNNPPGGKEANISLKIEGK